MGPATCERGEGCRECGELWGRLLLFPLTTVNECGQPSRAKVNGCSDPSRMKIWVLQARGVLAAGEGDTDWAMEKGDAEEQLGP